MAKKLIEQIGVGNSSTDRVVVDNLPEDLQDYRVEFDVAQWTPTEIRNWAKENHVKLPTEIPAQMQAKAAFLDCYLFLFYPAAESEWSDLTSGCVANCQTDEDLFAVLRKYLNEDCGYAGITRLTVG